MRITSSLILSRHRLNKVATDPISSFLPMVILAERFPAPSAITARISLIEPRRVKMGCTSKNIIPTPATAKIIVAALWNTAKYLGSVTGSLDIEVKAGSALPEEVLINAQNATISNGKLTVSLDERRYLQLTATVLPINANDKTVIWGSSNEETAYVSSDGLVVFLAEGTVFITAASAAQPGVNDVLEILVT